MEVSLNQAEVYQRADEFARLYLLRNSVAAKQANKRAELKADHEKVLAGIDERLEKLAGAVRNHREETDSQLSMEFLINDPATGQPVDVDALAEEIEAAAAATESKPRKPKAEKKSKSGKGRKAEEAQA